MSRLHIHSKMDLMHRFCHDNKRIAVDFIVFTQVLSYIDVLCMTQSTEERKGERARAAEI